MKRQWQRMTAALLLMLALAVQVCAAMPETLVPVGSAIGIELLADGVYVTGFAETGGKKTSAERAGLKAGDRISKVDGTQIEKTEELTRTISQHGGESLRMTVLRHGREMTFTVRPEQTAEGWKMGAYVRDSIAGIGTVTFYDPESNLYGALGHGVNDSATAEPLHMRSGVARDARVVDVVKGKRGTPGQLKGAFSQTGVLATVERNTSRGIFGTACTDLWDARAIPVAAQDEVRTGKAEILSTVSGQTVQRYEVRILELHPEEENGRNLLLEVTDPALLAKTGGIVQGMSGSPIIQDGKLVGAVTHVLVRDPKRGYGVFIQHMLDSSGAYEEAA